MKTAHILITLVLGMLSLMVNAQSLTSTFRGHTTDDLYYNNCSFLHLSYISGDGAVISCNNTHANWSDQYFAETTTGYVYTLANEGIMESKDFGKSFSQLVYAWLTPEVGIPNFCGGEKPGQAYLISHNYSTNNNNVLKTNNSFETVANATYFPTEIGVLDKEYYLLQTHIDNLCLLHTINDGLDFDTSYFPENVINENFIFYKLSRGSNVGELFLVTRHISALPIYKLYHSLDFGENWNEKELPANLTDDAKFTAGRGNCKFYIVDNNWNGGVTYTVKIYTSSDCGATYTLYSHELPTYVGLGDDKQKQPLLTVTPNPAGNTTNVHWQQNSSQKQVIQVLSSTGQMVLSTDIGVQPIGNQSFLLDVHSLSNGMYQIRLMGENGEIRCGKMVVCR